MLYFKPQLNIQSPSRPTFGSCISSRSFSSAAYRYGFNGKEKEANGTADNYDFGARIYDGRLGRWMVVDPLFENYPSTSDYASFLNNSIILVDPDGKDVVYIGRKGEEVYRKKSTTEFKTYIKSVQNASNEPEKDQTGWKEVPMPKIIQERTQSNEKVNGKEYQKNDYQIAARVGYFNQNKNTLPVGFKLYTDGGVEIPGSVIKSIPDLDPTLVKAMAIQESHNGITGISDILQTNNAGDWSSNKEKYGMTRTEKVSVTNSLFYGTRMLASKGFKGGVTYDKKTGKQTFSFQGWESALKNYNGGGNAKYKENVLKMVQNATVPKPSDY